MSQDSSLASALESLRAGKIVCIPTESSYGLAVDAGNATALETLVGLKVRAAQSAIGLIAGSLDQARSFSGAWPIRAKELADEFWPGPLTLVLPPPRSISDHLLGPSHRVAIRVSSLKVVRDLALQLGRPITATSANPKAQTPATSCTQAKEYFGEEVSYYLEGGTCTGSPSTLVDFDGEGTPIVLRQGPVCIVR